MRHHETSAAPKCPLPPALATWSALAAGLGLYLVDKYEGLPPAVITGVLLLAAAVKTGYFLLHNFRALAALRETFQQFLLLVSLNLSMIAHSFALDFYCLYRINDLTFAGLRPGSELDIFGQLFYQSVGTLISNSGGTLSAAGATQGLLLLEKIGGLVSTVFIISNAASYVGPVAKSPARSSVLPPTAAEMAHRPELAAPPFSLHS